MQTAHTTCHCMLGIYYISSRPNPIISAPIVVEHHLVRETKAGHPRDMLTPKGYPCSHSKWPWDSIVHHSCPNQVNIRRIPPWGPCPEVSLPLFRPGILQRDWLVCCYNPFGGGGCQKSLFFFCVVLPSTGGRRRQQGPTKGNLVHTQPPKPNVVVKTGVPLKRPEKGHHLNPSAWPPVSPRKALPWFEVWLASPEQSSQD